MKRYSISVTIHILLVVLLSIGSCIFCQQRLWFSAIFSLLLLVVLGIRLYQMQLKQIKMMRRLTDSIRYNDMTQTFYPPFKNKLMSEWVEELSETLKIFRNRLLDQEVKHQYYENLLNKVDTAVLVVSKSNQIEWMNQAAIAHLGQKCRLPEAILNLPTNGETQVVRIERNGIMLEMAVSGTLFTSQGKELLLVSLKNIHSVLERNEMEAWQKLIRVLTHEIMNSITPIISLSETLSERGISNQLSEKEYSVMLQAMQTIHRRSKGLLDFVENYRKLTRIPMPVRAEVVVNDLFVDMKKFFPEEDIHFILSEVRAMLYVDRTQIEQVLINLLKNAKEACCRKELYKIEVRQTVSVSGYHLITVSDSGEGILPEVMDKIFVPFFTTKNSGSGIGLSLCKQIVNLHGGTISVSSKIGEGSCFTLSFPPAIDGGG